MTGRPTRPWAWTLPCLFAMTVAPVARGETKVAIWEGLPKGWTWRTPEGPPADQFDAPALAFARLPAKYNARGIEVDRAGPFLMKAETTLAAPAGSYRLILRSRNAARLVVGGTVVAETGAINPNASGHEDVPVIPPPEDLRWRYLAVGDQERIVPWTSDGTPRAVELWVVVGDKKMRQETGELSVSLAEPGEVPVVIGGEGRLTLTDEGWNAFHAAESARLHSLDNARRREASRSEDGYWETRHEAARRIAEHDAPLAPPGEGNLIDRFMAEALKTAGAAPNTPADDAAFFRRLALDVIGVIPDPKALGAFLDDPSPDKRTRAVDAMLADPRWADGWMGYWQDVLAENPGILKPTLNNTGPFRKYLHAAFLDNTPADRLVTELTRMEGSTLGGGPAGFGVASQNDAPMAAKAQILAKAFLAAEMKCARCHDSPSHPYDQADLFGLAGMLAGKPVAVPLTSTVRSLPGGRTPAVSITLKAGERVAPHWSLNEIGDEDVPEDLLPANASPRDRLALLITSPTNRRFAPVMVNRLWKRYMGVGLVEPVDDWDDSPSMLNPALLDAMARAFVTGGYDLKKAARLILTSATYQSRLRPGPSSDDERLSLAAIPSRRRMSAEQVLDSIFAAVGKPFRAEELNLDPDGRRPPSDFLNLGVPSRAWQFTSLSNERDRPALSLPVAQSLVDVLETFGWRASRQDPLTDRDEATTALQPAMLANGVAARRAIRLSDDSAITALCLEDQPAEALVRKVYLRVLSRVPTAAETARAVEYLGDSHRGRVVPGAKVNTRAFLAPARRVSWSNHLSPEATRIQLELEKAARAGDPPTERLAPPFRERMEDLVWALLNSPEFVFVP